MWQRHLLIHEEPHLGRALVERVSLAHAAAPDTQEVDACTLMEPHLIAISRPVCRVPEKEIGRDPVAAQQEDLLAIDPERTAASAVVDVRFGGANADAELLRMG